MHGDERGFFQETYREDAWAAEGVSGPFVQDNHSRSVRGTLRGLHFQRTPGQAKLVRVVTGTIFDVAVDIRPASPTFGKWAGAKLTAENAEQLWVPPGFGHGFCVLSEEADVEYKCSALYDPKDEIAIQWNDPAIGVRWPVAEPVLSARDQAARPLAECKARLLEGAR
ncbi:MAG TPA: dTDP-4-dehydrorhamnose 3,5-epimerase [Myxococcota bacterium]|nr:dTDP-4-dehydrorhamnose 3,5-epimerase [Myxococcota bacterium]